MAVRDKEQGLDDHDGRRLSWRDVLGHLPTILVVGGLFVYAWLIVCYERFYGSLGVEPDAVGLDYLSTLARSSGFAVAFLSILWVLVSTYDKLLRGPTGLRPQPPAATAPWVTGIVLTLIAGALMVSLLNQPWVDAEDAAHDVQQGKPIGPVEFQVIPWSEWKYPLSILAIHADPATVEPTGKPGASPAADRLRGRRLLYLGQAGGTIVLYDAAVQRAVYVPASTVILQVANCRGAPPDPACSVAAGAVRPDHPDRDAALAGVGHHVRGPPEPA
jgi:hypothetical protein